MVPWGVNFRITKSKAKLRTSCEQHGYTCTSMDSLLLFIQNSLHCKQGGLYETSFLFVLQLFPSVIIQTRSSFLILYSGCYPPVIIQTGSSFLILYSGCYPPVTIQTGSLVPRPLPDFISQPWRKIGRRPGTITTSRTGNGGLDFIMMATCPRNMRPVPQAIEQ